MMGTNLLSRLSIAYGISYFEMLETEIVISECDWENHRLD